MLPSENSPSTPAHRLSRGRVAALCAVALVIVTLLFEWTDLDLRVQDACYDFGVRAWRVDARDAAGRLWFYNGPKALVWVLGLGALTLLVGPERWRRRGGWSRRGLGVAVLTLATLPALVGLGKKYSNVFCPSEVRRYGGDFPYVKAFAAYPADDRPEQRGHGFPAGHASGGFALAGLFWARDSRRWRLAVVLGALALGWWMGGYQMLKGAHYLSHTLTTQLLAPLVALAWAALVRPERAQAEAGARRKS